MKDQWTQDEMFPEVTSVWFQFGVNISGEGDSISLHWKATKAVWPFSLGVGGKQFNYTENGLKSLLEEVHAAIQDLEEYTGLALGPMEILRDSAPF